MPNRNRLALVLLIALLVAALFWLRNLNTPEIASLVALNDQQKSLGFVPIGHFGDSWPARIIEQREQDDRISFSRNNGQPHTYQGFDGYRLKMIRLIGRNSGEVIVIYRSENPDSALIPEQGDKPLIRRK